MISTDSRLMERGYGSPTADKFPAGLRVLVVDDDPTWLKILEKMLKRCSYEVTTCCLAREALKMLRERKGGFDLVISDVNMPDMDGFKLLEHVGLEMDLPVIMMSVDGETSRVMKGVQHGACDYLLKPIRMKELSNIWQHVLRKKIHEAKDTDYYECSGNFQLIKSKSEDFHDKLLSNEGCFGVIKKRKEVENKKQDDQESSKKARVVWSIDLHQKFVDAVNLIGFDKVGPKKILDTMKVPGLTRENVASHLQKFRLYLDRLQKENELNSSLHGTKPLDFPAEVQNNFAMDLSTAVTDNSRHTRNRMPVNEMVQNIDECEFKGMLSFVPAKKRKIPQIDPTHIIKSSLDQSFEYKKWNGVPMMQFKQSINPIPKQEPKPYSLIQNNHATQFITDSNPQWIDNLTRVHEMSIVDGGTALMPSLEENIQFLLQEYSHGENIGYQNTSYISEAIDEGQTSWYGEFGVYSDKLRDSIESTFVDQGLFIA